MSDIFSKTAKGQEEIKTRAGGLTQRMRQVLIFVDGKRSREDLHGMLKGDDMNDLLASLVEEGYIEIVGKSDSKAAPAKPAAAPAAAQAAAGTPATGTTPAAGKPAATPPQPKQLSEEELKKIKREQELREEMDVARGFMSKM